MPQLPAGVLRRRSSAWSRADADRRRSDEHHPRPGRPGPAGEPPSWRARPPWRSWAGPPSGSARGLVVTSSMADTVMVHLAEQVAPGIDVVFLDTGYHFVETIGTRDAVRAVHDVNVIDVTAELTVAEQDAALRQGPVRHRPRPLLRDAQGRPAGPGPRALRRLGHRPAPRRLRRPGAHARRRLGRAPPHDQGRAHRHLDRRRRGRLHRAERPDGQPAAGGRLRLHRLRALHPAQRGRRRPQPAAGPAWPRPSAGSTCERPVHVPGHRPGGGPRPDAAGATLWFTGLPSAGKSTIAHALADQLRAEGRRVQVLDGDEVRPHLSAGLGFSRADRDINVTPDRLGGPAAGRPRRDGARARHRPVRRRPAGRPPGATPRPTCPFAEVFVSTSLAVAESRDVKGLYAKARQGEISGLTGVDDPYEEPRSAELVLDTAEVDLATSVELAAALLTAIREDQP